MIIFGTPIGLLIRLIKKAFRVFHIKDKKPKQESVSQLSIPERKFRPSDIGITPIPTGSNKTDETIKQINRDARKIASVTMLKLEADNKELIASMKESNEKIIEALNKLDLNPIGVGVQPRVYGTNDPLTEHLAMGMIEERE